MLQAFLSTGVFLSSGKPLSQRLELRLTLYDKLPQEPFGLVWLSCNRQS